MPKQLHRRSPYTCCAITSIPFWLVGELVDTEALPVNLPVSALMAFDPMVVALVLIYQEQGMAAVKDLLRRIFDYAIVDDPKLWVNGAHRAEPS